MKILVYLLGIAFLAGSVAACEPKPPKPKTDFTHERSNP
jgi:hypothetical protein